MQSKLKKLRIANEAVEKWRFLLNISNTEEISYNIAASAHENEIVFIGID